MLSEQLKDMILVEVFRGDPIPLLNRLRNERSAEYVDACEFAIQRLKSFHEVPSSKGAAFWVNYHPLLGTVISCDSWREDGTSFICEVGCGIRHPSPLPPEPTLEPDISTPRARSYFRPARDFKASAANDR